MKYLSSILGSYGLEIGVILIVPDNGSITSEVKRLAGEVDLLVVTGGLGPTSDDITRAEIAQAAGVELEMREELWADILEKFGGVEPSESNRRQAEIPRGFFPIENTCGTAPGFYGMIEKCRIVALPGPPVELREMARRFLESYLTDNFEGQRGTAAVGTSFLISESVLEDGFAEVAHPGEVWRTRAEGHRIVFSFESNPESEDIFDRLAGKFGNFCIRRGETTAAEILSNTLFRKDIQIVCAESCTGGLISKMLTD
ncbi:MAG: hypothetical protein HN368_23145, partial [Spirochaetales bacterium]|nr:hypothetical protein [Spirochaetales bacterium]